MTQISKWIIAGLMILTAGMLAACDDPETEKDFPESQMDMFWQEAGAQTGITGSEEVSAESRQDMDLCEAEELWPEDEQDTDLCEAEKLPPEDVQDTEQYLRQATVQIQGSQYLGSGVIWAAEEEYLVIATAAHVAADNEPLAVQFVQGEPLTAELSAVEDRVDLAFLRVDRALVQEQGIPWQAARQDQKVCDALAAGEELLIMGSIEETADRIYSGSVTESWIYLEDFDNYMLLGRAYAIPGVSGGGVFTADGILVGILCGGNDADEIAVLPYSVMAANSNSL